MSNRPAPPQRGDYLHVSPLETRWMDNDVYGHLNNVVYYSLFDTIINRYLIRDGGLDIHRGSVAGYAVQSACTFAGSVKFPEAIEGGLRVGMLGTTSVRYLVAVFAVGDPSARAFGDFTHVFVDRETERPTPIPDSVRLALSKLVRTAS